MWRSPRLRCAWVELIEPNRMAIGCLRSIPASAPPEPKDTGHYGDQAQIVRERLLHLLTAESTLSPVGVADPAASDAECIADQFCYWRLPPFGRVTPYCAARWPRDGAAWPETGRLCPFGLRSLPRGGLRHGRRKNLPPNRLAGGRSSKLAAREAPQVLRGNRHGLTAHAFRAQILPPEPCVAILSSAPPVLRSGKSSARRSHPGQSTGDRTLSSG